MPLRRREAARRPKDLIMYVCIGLGLLVAFKMTTISSLLEKDHALSINTHSFRNKSSITWFFHSMYLSTIRIVFLKDSSRPKLLIRQIFHN